MAKRIVVNDAQKNVKLYKEKALREKLAGKAVVDMKQAELAELILLLAGSAGLVDGEGKVKG